MNIIKNCKECELSSDSCNCICLDLAAAPVRPSANEFLHCHECSNPECCSSCSSNLDLAAAPAPVVPTSTGSQRPAQYACPFCGRIALQSVCLECGTKAVLVSSFKEQSK